MNILLIFFLTLSVIYCVKWFLQRKRELDFFKRVGIPGPEPSFLTGNLYAVRWSEKTVGICMSNWRKQFGDIFGYYWGTVPHVVVHDLDLVKEVLISDFNSYRNRNTVLSLQFKELQMALQGLKDEEWKQVRAVLTPVFTLAKMKHLSKYMGECVERVREVFEESRIKDEAVDVSELFMRFTSEIISYTALATETDPIKNPLDWFYVTVTYMFRATMNAPTMLAIYFPILKPLVILLAPFTPFGRIKEGLRKRLTDEIENRKTWKPDVPDLVQLMLEARESEKDRLSFYLSDNHVIASSMFVLLGGYESTSNAMSFVTYCLATHPDVQEKLYEEIRDFFPDGKVDLNRIHHIKYLDQVINESLRVFPPSPSFRREVSVDFAKLGPYTLPRGTAIEINAWDIHHDPKVWPEPWKFDPSRFELENKLQQHPMAWLPFGAGPRNCIGTRFALNEMKICLSKLMLQYNFVTCEKTEAYPPELDMLPAARVCSKNGLWIKVEKRDPID